MVALLVVGVAGGVAVRSDEGPPVPSPAHRERHDPDVAPRTDGVVWAAPWATTSTRSTGEKPDRSLPSEGELLKDPRTAPLPAWSAFDQATGRFLWTDQMDDPDSEFWGARTLVVLSRGADPEVAQISCTGMCANVVSFGPAPDEVTVLVEDLSKDHVNPGPASLARVYGIDGSVRDEIDLAEVLGTERHVLEETQDWAPPDGSEALVADIEWSPDGTRLAVSTQPGFFEPDCPPAGLPCEAKIWSFDRDGGDPVLMYRQSPDAQVGGVWQTPILGDLSWTSDGSRLGMIVTSDLQLRTNRPPGLVSLDVESGDAVTLHEFDTCGTCRPAPYGFAWSPDGTRLAVTSGDGISVLNPGGTVLADSADGGPGPLAWLGEAP